MKKNLLNEVKLLGCDAYQNHNDRWVIEIPIDHRKLFLQEQKNNEWLLISRGNPQMFLNTRQMLKYMKIIKKNTVVEFP